VGWVSLGNHLPGIVRERARLGHQVEGFDHIRVGFGPDFQTFFLAEGVDEKLALEVRAQPIVVLEELGFRVGNLFGVEELAEIQEQNVVHFKALGDLVREGVALREIE
jgi:hypothetical protein